MVVKWFVKISSVSGSRSGLAAAAAAAAGAVYTCPYGQRRMQSPGSGASNKDGRYAPLQLSSDAQLTKHYS